MAPLIVSKVKFSPLPKIVPEALSNPLICKSDEIVEEAEDMNPLFNKILVEVALPSALGVQANIEPAAEASIVIVLVALVIVILEPAVKVFKEKSPISLPIKSCPFLSGGVDVPVPPPPGNSFVAPTIGDGSLASEVAKIGKYICKPKAAAPKIIIDIIKIVVLFVMFLKSIP